jgi:hypothetical protein
MSKITESPFFILAVAVLVVVLPLLGLAHLRRRRRVSEQEQKARFEQRRLQPDYAAFKSHYGCEPPLSLRQLYGDRETLLDGDFEIRLPSSRRPWSVAWFEPMELDTWADIEGFYAFANDGCGNLYIVALQGDDPEVFFLDHETGEREALGVCLSQFLATERTR